MPSPEFLGNLMLKAIGALAGTVLALIFRLPKNWREFKRRAAFSFLTGIFASPLAILGLREVIDVPSDPETLVAIVTVTAFGSWWVAGAVLKRVSIWTWKDDGD